MYLFIDFETYSPEPIKNGIARYSRHADADVICGVFDMVNKDRETVESFKLTSEILRDPLQLETFSKFISEIFKLNQFIVAHNIEFDLEIYIQVLQKKYHFNPFPANNKFICTKKRQSFYGHKSTSLAVCGDFYNLEVQKDPRGKELIELLSIPNEKGERRFDEALEKEMLDYCSKDVETLKSLFFRQQDFAKMFRIQNNDYRTQCVDLEINRTGFPINIELAKALTVATDEQKAIAQLDFCKRFNNFNLPSLTQGAELMKFIGRQCNYHLKSLEKAEIPRNLPADVKEILDFRERATKSSMAKAKRALQLEYDGRIYNQFVYCDAHTGRWTGRDLQPQNLPKERDEGKITSYIRNMIATGANSVFIDIDYSAIEHQMLFYMATQFMEKFGVNCDETRKHYEGFFIAGKDAYIDLAAKIYNVPRDSLNKESPERAVGKEAHLGLGYNMAADTFSERPAIEKIGMPLNDIERIVQIYRSTYTIIPQLWSYFQNNFVNCLKEGGDFENDLFWGMKMKFVQKLPFRPQTNCLSVVLPSGRPIFYYDLVLSQEQNRYNSATFHSLKYSGKKLYGGKIIENMIQAICRDLLAEHLVEISKNMSLAKVVLHVHDEILVESADDKLEENRTQLEKICKTNPTWLPGFPAKCEMFTSKYYKK